MPILNYTIVLFNHLSVVFECRHRGCSVGYFASFSAFLITAAYLTRYLDLRPQAIGSIAKGSTDTTYN